VCKILHNLLQSDRGKSLSLGPIPNPNSYKLWCCTRGGWVNEVAVYSSGIHRRRKGIHLLRALVNEGKQRGPLMDPGSRKTHATISAKVR
jgi:hypothetical protein